MSFSIVWSKGYERNEIKEKSFPKTNAIFASDQRQDHPHAPSLPGAAFPQAGQVIEHGPVFRPKLLVKWGFINS
jgi:hypothetical protein